MRPLQHNATHLTLGLKAARNIINFFAVEKRLLETCCNGYAEENKQKFIPSFFLREEKSELGDLTTPCILWN